MLFLRFSLNSDVFLQNFTKPAFLKYFNILGTKCEAETIKIIKHNNVFCNFYAGFSHFHRFAGNLDFNLGRNHTKTRCFSMVFAFRAAERHRVE